MRHYVWLQVDFMKRGVAAGILDGGDSNIFLGEDKFKQFMKAVESITGGLPEVTTHAVTGSDEINTEKELSVAANEAPQKDLFEEEIITEEKREPAIIPTPAIEDEVLEKGAGFLENLVQVLSNPESTQRLVNKLTETDATTGKTYLKIPVSNTNVVENALKLFGTLFSGMRK